MYESFFSVGIHWFYSFVVLDESAADDTIAGKQHCIIQNCQFAPVLSHDDAAHDWRGFAVCYFKRVRFFLPQTNLNLLYLLVFII